MLKRYRTFHGNSLFYTLLSIDKKRRFWIHKMQSKTTIINNQGFKNYAKLKIPSPPQSLYILLATT